MSSVLNVIQLLIFLVWVGEFQKPGCVEFSIVIEWTGMYFWAIFEDWISYQVNYISVCTVVVFNLLEPGNISKALCGEQVGTLIDQSGRIS